MPTKQQLEEAIRRADAAGDANAVKILGGQLKALSAVSPKPQSKPASFFDTVTNVAKSLPGLVKDTGKEMMLGAVEAGVNAASDLEKYSPINPARQIISAFGGKDTIERAEKHRNEFIQKGINAVADRTIERRNPMAREASRIGASFAIPGPKGLTKIPTILGRAAQGAAQGAVVRDINSDITEPAATGAVANVVLPAALRPVTKLASKLAAPVINKFSVGLGANPLEGLGPRAVERAEQFKEFGIENPTVGMISRNPEAFNFEQNVAKTTYGKELQSQMHKVESALISEGQKLAGKYAGMDAEVIGRNAQNFLENKQKEVQELTSKLYEEVQATRGDEFVGRLDNLREKMTDPDIVHNADFDKVRKSVTNRMKDLGLISKDGRISKGATLNQAEAFRRFIGGLGNGTKPSIRMLRAKLIDALDDDVVDVIGDDAFKAARANAKAGFEEFKKSYAGKVIDEKIAPEKLVNHLFSGNVSLNDLRSFRRSFLLGTKEQVAQGKPIWEQIKSHQVENFFQNAVNTEGRLDGYALMKSLPENRAKLREVLGAKEYKKLENLVIASRNATSAPIGELGDNTSAVTGLFQSLPEKTKSGWLSFLTRNTAMHSAAWAAGGPAANVALVGGQTAVGSLAEQKATRLFLQRIQMAKNPKEAAAAIKAAETAAETNALLNKTLRERGLLSGVAATVGNE